MEIANSTPALYDVPEVMALLNVNRTQLYELIRSRWLVTVGRRRLVHAEAVSDYVALLVREAGGTGGRAA